jgi:hypothetical protein
VSLSHLGRSAAYNNTVEMETAERSRGLPDTAERSGAPADEMPAPAPPGVGIPEPAPPSGGVPAVEQAKAGFIGQLLAYIPGDALAAYVAITAFILESSGFWRFLAVLGVTIATPLWVILAYRDSTDDPAVLHRWPVFEMSVGTVAFVAWSTSVPGSWWQADLDLSAQAGGAIAVATSIVLGLGIRYYEQQHRVPRVVPAAAS